MKNLTITFIVFILFCSQIFAHKEWVHQHIVYQANLLLQNYYLINVPEISDNLGSYGSGDGKWLHGEILKGAFREDLEDVVTGTGGFTQGWDPSCTHFWNVDDSDFGNTPITTGWTTPVMNAYHKAYKFFYGGWELSYAGSVYKYNSLSDLYVNGNLHKVAYFDSNGSRFACDIWIVASAETRRLFVWEILGRICHLLEDMTVPAHVHVDPHVCFLDDPDDYEQVVAGASFGLTTCNQRVNYPALFESFTAQTAFNSGTLINPYNYDNNPLRYLFYYAAQVTDHFASQDYGGDNTLLNSPYPEMQEYINNLGPAPSAGQVVVANDAQVLMNLSIRLTASMLYSFAWECDLIKMLNVTSSKNDDYLQIRNPARSVAPYTSQYYWQPTPYTLKFEDSIKVDLLADAYSGTHCFIDWDKRDKHNVIIDGNSQLEWLNATAQATSTFIANYAPWITVSLNPIEIESASANAHYENLTTGESGSSFTFPQGYPITIKAIAPDGYIFLKWSDDYIGNPRSFNPNSNMAGIYASFKKVGASDNINAYKNCGQRKFVKNYSGVLFSVYPSMEKVWIEYSTNNGQSWQLGNDGKPLFGELEAKNPSIEFWNKEIDETQLLIAAQVNINGEPDIQISRLKWNPYMVSWPSMFKENSHVPIEPSTFGYGSYSSTNWNPLLGMIDIGGFIIAIPISDVIWIEADRIIDDYTFTEFDGDIIYPENEVLNASLYSSKLELDCVQTDEYQCWLAYEEKISSNSSKIVVTKLYFDPWSWNNIIYTPPFTVSENDGFSNNYSPSITAWRESEASTTSAAAVVWIGYREAYADNPIYSTGETKVILRRFSNGAWSPSFQTYGSSINSVNINKNTDKSYAFAWSQGNNNINYYVKSSYLTRLNSANTNGKYLQVGNFTNLNNMRLNAFRTSTSPYSFQLSNVFGYIQEEEVRTDRASIIVKDTTSFYFAIGDIQVNDEMVGFIEIPDSITIDTKENLNTYLLSEPFNLTDNTSFIYGIKFGVSDSISAVTSLNNNKSVHFKVQLIDDQTGEVIGTLDNIVFDSENIIPYENIAYQVNTLGIGDRICRLKLIADDNLDFNYSLVNSYNDETSLSKKGFIEKIFNGNEVVKSYALAQNYPNPFNPNTTIRYQITKNGLVTLKIYDILGAEVATLVNEEKITGKYEVNFNASSLASGVYIYRIQSGEFVNSKKMLLLK